MGLSEMTVYGVSFDPAGKQPIVLLRTSDGTRILPIWIGHPEAAAILMKLQGTPAPRPMTHDLLTTILDELDAEVTQIAVTELKDNTFYARITIVTRGQEIEVDSRPSDAIALAVRLDARIFAADDVIEESSIEYEGEEDEGEAATPRITTVPELSELDPAEFRKFLDTVTAEDFGLAAPEGDEAEEADEEA